MSGRRLVYPPSFAALVLLLAGCGGEQNPVRPDVGSRSGFFDGLWDGFSVLVVVLLDLARDRDYLLYDRSGTDAYLVGYVLGVILLIMIVSAMLRRLRVWI